MDTQKIFDASMVLWKSAPKQELCKAVRYESGAGAGTEPAGNLMLLGDNLPLMASVLTQIESGARAPLGLVYMDPPYFSGKNRSSRIKVKTEDGEKFVTSSAYTDSWADMDSYLTMLTARLIAAHELLAEDGSLWIHLDRRAVHYAKVMADLVFEKGGGLANEIIWSYKSGGSSKRSFANKHDTLLFYAKNIKKHKFFPLEEKSYNRGLRPYRFKGVKEYRDEYGWYTVVKMKDVWDIPMVGRTAAERTGYATQKPEALLERIVLSCTDAGDCCMDPFSGSGTLMAVCAKHGRNWICIDQNPLAINMALDRYNRARSAFT